jgi:hypothetical protein
MQGMNFFGALIFAMPGRSMTRSTARRFVMCYEYELEYQLRRAEEARRELKKAEERNKPKPAAPAEAPVAPPAGGQEEPVPV